MSKFLITSFFSFSVRRWRFVLREGKKLWRVRTSGKAALRENGFSLFPPHSSRAGLRRSLARTTSKTASYEGYLGFYWLKEGIKTYPTNSQ